LHARNICRGAPVAHPSGVFLKESKITQVVARPDRPAGITRHHIREGLAARRSGLDPLKPNAPIILNGDVA
jgi:hypothetical protein